MRCIGASKAVVSKQHCYGFCRCLLQEACFGHICPLNSTNYYSMDYCMCRAVWQVNNSLPKNQLIDIFCRIHTLDAFANTEGKNIIFQCLYLFFHIFFFQNTLPKDLVYSEVEIEFISSLCNSISQTYFEILRKIHQTVITANVGCMTINFTLYINDYISIIYHENILLTAIFHVFVLLQLFSSSTYTL